MAADSSIPKTMRAWQWSSVSSGLSKSITLAHAAPVPATPSTLASNQALIRVLYTSLNPVDYKLPELPFMGRILALRKPMSPCLDFCGEVVAAGSAVAKDAKPGQVIFGATKPPGYGTLAGYAVVNQGNFAVLPEGVNPRDAATAGIAAVTAWQCIVPRLPEKEHGGGGKVFINGGSGGTGTYGIQIAKAKGAYVVTTCSSRNVELCKKLGADEVLDYTKGGVLQALTKSAKDKGEFDVVVDNVGGATDLYWQAHQYLKAGKSYVTVGALPELKTGLDLLKIFFWPSWLGGGQRKYEFLTAMVNPKDLSEIAALMREGKIKPEIEEVYDMEDAPRAFERIKSGRTRGKLVIKVTA